MLKHLGAMGLARGLYALSQAVLLILLARDVGPQGYGVIASFLAVHTFLFLLAGMNTPTFVTREMALGQTAMAVAAIRLNAKVMGLAISIAVASSVAIVSEAPLLLAVLGNAIAVWSERVTENRLAVAYGQKRVQPSVTTLVVRSLAPLGLYLGLAALGVTALIAFAVARVAAGLASQLLGTALIRLPTVTQNPGVRDLFKIQAPLATSTAMGAIRTLDSVVVIALAGATVSGIYSAVSRVVSPFNTLAQSVTPVLVPRAALATSAYVRRLIGYLLLGGLALSALTLVVLPLKEPIVIFIFGPSFAGGGTVLFWVLLRIGPVAASPLISSALQAQGLDRLAALNSVVTSLLALAAVAGGAVFAGAAGAAAGFATITLLGMVALVWSGRRLLGKANT